MFEHDFGADSHTEFGSSDSEFNPSVLEQEGYTPQEIGMIEQEYSALSPDEINYIEQEQATLQSMPSGEGSQIEQEMVQNEEANAQQTMNDTMTQAESFDQTLLQD